MKLGTGGAENILPFQRCLQDAREWSMVFGRGEKKQSWAEGRGRGICYVREREGDRTVFLRYRVAFVNKG